jgi:site-specific DNA recombinase
MRVFIYCRVSTDEQATDAHYSLANQEQKARDYAKSKGWHVAAVVKDVASGKDANRDGYQELLSAIKKRSIDGVVVYRLDRLSRNVRDIYDFLYKIQSIEIGFISLSEGFDTTTAMGRAMLGVAAVFAQLTREMIAENVRDGLMRRAQAGLYNGNKYGPYGYRYDKESGMLVIVPEEAKVVRRIFELFARRKWGHLKIAELLNQEFVPTRENGNWEKCKVRNIVKNPTYMGLITWHGEEYAGKHEAIIDEELFATARELTSNRKTEAPRTQQTEHLIASIAECGWCGKKLRVHYGAAKKDGTRHRFYKHNRDPKRDSCKGFYKSADRLESVVVSEITKAAGSHVIQEGAIKEIELRLAQESGPLQQERDKIAARLSQMNVQFNNWADRLDRGSIDEDQFNARNAKLLQTKAEITKRLQQIDVTLAQREELQLNLESAKEALRDFPLVWENLEIQEKRELLRQLLDQLVIYPDRMVMRLLLMPPIEISF